MVNNYHCCDIGNMRGNVRASEVEVLGIGFTALRWPASVVIAAAWPMLATLHPELKR